MRTSLAALTLAALVAASGCAGAAPPQRVVVREEVIVARPPPALRTEVILVRPGPPERFVWRPGFWRWDGRDYDWVPGAWIERRGPRGEWVRERWVVRHGGWVFVPGHWRR